MESVLSVLRKILSKEELFSSRIQPLTAGRSGAHVFRIVTNKRTCVLKLLALDSPTELQWQTALNEHRAYHILRKCKPNWTADLYGDFMEKKSGVIALLVEDVGYTAPKNDELFRVLGKVHSGLRDCSGEINSMEKMDCVWNPWVWNMRKRPVGIPAKFNEPIVHLDWLLNLHFSSSQVFQIGPIHGDLRADNFMVKSGVVRVIDWENFSWGPLTRDIGTLYGSLHGLNFKYLEKALQIYGVLDDSGFPYAQLVTAVQVEVCRGLAEQVPDLIHNRLFDLAESRIASLREALENLHETKSGLRL